MRDRGFPRWFGALIGLGLIAGLLSLYLAGDWRDGDVSLYHAYALGFWGGLAHPLLPAEYPPLAILPLSLTLAGPPAWYPDVFAFWMGVLAVLGYVGFRRWASPDRAAAYALYALATGIATIVFRYDLLPALLSVAALWLVQRNRFAAAYPLLAVATLFKLYPAVLLPVLVVAHWRASSGAGDSAKHRVSLGIASFAATIAAVTAAAAVLDPYGWTSALGYEAGRPIEVESVLGTLVALGSVGGIHASAVASYDSLNITSGLAVPLAIASSLALVAGLLWTYRRQHHGRFSPGQAAVAAVLVLLSTSKVLSAQYLLWLVPLVATTVGFRMRWFILFLLTALVFPGLWEVALGQQGGEISYGVVFLGGIGVRNAVLVVCTLRYLIKPGADLGAQPARRASPEAFSDPAALPAAHRRSPRRLPSYL